ncbi:cytochrome P450 [Zhongshania aquimaris]|uniref:Cytochrome P450 n=1 Tax=Zhongshania aquimaris TaxID=2857107 RepID=A0ABS6VWI0_9GAMM|nr:cytochrome P450 [Zhongshania aquimaris]MBW2942720.1 cytochrome P450 [Zhongshania aquimaris]
MSDKLVSDDSLYEELFDVEKETAATGGHIVGDLSDQLSGLRDTAAVMKGSLREILNFPEIHQAFNCKREHYTVFSYELCNRALRENLLFSSEVYKESPGVQRMGHVILKMVGKEHLAYRSMVQPMFIRPRAIDWWKKNWIEGSVKALLDRMEGRSATADLNQDLCARLPVHIVTQGMGLSGDSALAFRENLMKSTVQSRSLPIEEVMKSAAEVERMLREVISARREQPADDVITGLVQGVLNLPDEEARGLTDDEIFAYARLIMLAGGGTTWRQLGITLYQLLRKPELWEACRNDRSLIERAIDEGARWMPTDPIFPRLVTKDVELAGVKIPAGSRIDMCLGSANRDPSIWDRPDEYDIYRERKSHLGFGMGPHRCLGMEVAKQEMLVAINGLMDRFPNIQLDMSAPPAELVGGLEQRGMSSVPVTLY